MDWWIVCPVLNAFDPDLHDCCDRMVGFGPLLEASSNNISFSTLLALSPLASPVPKPCDPDLHDCSDRMVGFGSLRELLAFLSCSSSGPMVDDPIFPTPWREKGDSSQSDIIINGLGHHPPLRMLFVRLFPLDSRLAGLRVTPLPNTPGQRANHNSDSGRDAGYTRNRARSSACLINFPLESAPCKVFQWYPATASSSSQKDTGISVLPNAIDVTSSN